MIALTFIPSPPCLYVCPYPLYPSVVLKSLQFFSPLTNLGALFLGGNRIADISELEQLVDLAPHVRASSGHMLTLQSTSVSSIHPSFCVVLFTQTNLTISPSLKIFHFLSLSLFVLQSAH